MMTQAFYTGLTGLRASSQAIDVITDNLANTSTNGFRGYHSEFSSMYEKMIHTPSGSSSVKSSIGVGTSLNAIVMDESLGVFQLTDRSSDLAILGDGWFGVQGNGETMYTRDGNFSFDSNRDLVAQDGFFVLGTMGTNMTDGVLTEDLAQIPLSEPDAQEKLSFPKELSYPGIATTEADFYGNLTLDENILTVSSTVITSEGVKNNLRLQFSKANPQVPPGVQWDVQATTQSINDDTIYDTQNGVVAFNEKGALTSNTLGSIDNQGSSVNIDLGTGYSGLISISAPLSVSSEADGLLSGTLLGYEINRYAEVIATFTNGEQSNVGSIAVFQFVNDRGLERTNGSRFTQSANSGKPIFAKDSNGNNIIGTDITNFKLEGSNVQMEVALTDLIIMQRAYDSSSKLITTADQMLQKALSMDA